MTRTYKKRCRIALTAAERPVIWPLKFSSCRARTYQHAYSVRASSRANGNPGKPMTRAVRGNSRRHWQVAERWLSSDSGQVAGGTRERWSGAVQRETRLSSHERARIADGPAPAQSRAQRRHDDKAAVASSNQCGWSDGFECRRYHGGPMPLRFALRCCDRESDELTRYDGWSHQRHRLRRDACGDGRSLRQCAA